MNKEELDQYDIFIDTITPENWGQLAVQVTIKEIIHTLTARVADLEKAIDEKLTAKDVAHNIVNKLNLKRGCR